MTRLKPHGFDLFFAGASDLAGLKEIDVNISQAMSGMTQVSEKAKTPGYETVS